MRELVRTNDAVLVSAVVLLVGLLLVPWQQNLTGSGRVGCLATASQDGFIAIILYAQKLSATTAAGGATVDEMFTSMERSAGGIVHLGIGLARQTDGSYKIEMILYGKPAWEGNRLRTGDVVKSIVINSTGSDGKATTTTTHGTSATGSAAVRSLVVAVVGHSNGHGGTCLGGLWSSRLKERWLPGEWTSSDAEVTHRSCSRVLLRMLRPVDEVICQRA